MNEKIKQHLIEHNKKNGWGTTEKDLIETLTESSTIHSEIVGSRRHWDELFEVVEIDGMLIGFENAHTTGDLTPSEAGWEFDPSTICEVVAKERKITVYERV